MNCTNSPIFAVRLNPKHLSILFHFYITRKYRKKINKCSVVIVQYPEQKKKKKLLIFKEISYLMNVSNRNHNKNKMKLKSIGVIFWI